MRSTKIAVLRLVVLDIRAFVGLAVILTALRLSSSYFETVHESRTKAERHSNKRGFCNQSLPLLCPQVSDQSLTASASVTRGAATISNHPNGSTQLIVNSETIAQAISQLVLIPGRLLVYDPKQDAFLLFTVAPDPEMMHWWPCSRCASELPLLMQVLLEARPERFAPNSSLFQLFFTDSDLTYTRNSSSMCSFSNSCMPWLHFGSYFRVASILPMVHPFPNHEYLSCIHEWAVLQKSEQGNATKRERDTSNRILDRSCTKWPLPYHDNVEWQNLTPKIVWRGNDYDFLPTIERHVLGDNNGLSLYSIPQIPFRPRQVVVEMSRNTTWLDAKFTAGVSRRNRLSLDDLSLFRYHIDLGGAGGTTWRGTLEKLAMPGLLFHHETPTQDWFYAELLPWYHYVPIRTDLTNLQERFEWAESNPDKAQAIARQGTEFARQMVSYKRLSQEYKRYFGEASILHTALLDYAHAAVNNSSESLDSVLSFYESNHHIRHEKIATCTREFCDLRITFDISTRHFLNNGSCVFIASSRRSRIGRSC